VRLREAPTQALLDAMAEITATILILLNGIRISHALSLSVKSCPLFDCRRSICNATYSECDGAVRVVGTTECSGVGLGTLQVAEKSCNTAHVAQPTFPAENQDRSLLRTALTADTINRSPGYQRHNS